MHSVRKSSDSSFVVPPARASSRTVRVIGMGRLPGRGPAGSIRPGDRVTGRMMMRLSILRIPDVQDRPQGVVGCARRTDPADVKGIGAFGAPCGTRARMITGRSRGPSLRHTTGDTI